MLARSQIVLVEIWPLSQVQCCDVNLFVGHGVHPTELHHHAHRLPRHLAEGLLEALEEMKPTSVVGVELLDVELGSSAPRILGIKVRPGFETCSPLLLALCFIFHEKIDVAVGAYRSVLIGDPCFRTMVLRK